MLEKGSYVVAVGHSEMLRIVESVPYEDSYLCWKASRGVSVVVAAVDIKRSYPPLVDPRDAGVE